MDTAEGSSGPSPASWRTGTHVGRYRVQRMFARGGMGEIYIADYEAEPGRRDYRVLKRLIGATQGIPEQAQMFLDEGRLTARLRHPNIVAVHEVGSEAGTYYIAMDYLHGVDVRAVLQKVLMAGGTMPIGQAIRLAVGACAGMHHAHELRSESGEPLQIVHRDISPQNLFLTFDGEVKLLDFGVAKDNRHDRETTTRGMKGKVPYMSPEQCLSRPIDRRSDIFSLGVILYELTVGARLFRGNSDYEMMQQIVTGDVVPPCTLDPDYPAALDRIVMKALQKPVDKRYQSALAMSRELEEFARTASLDLSPDGMRRFLLETVGELPEAWQLTEDAPPNRSGPLIIERGEARQTVMMPHAPGMPRSTPQAMRAAAGPVSGEGDLPAQRTLVGLGPATGGAREPTGGGRSVPRRIIEPFSPFTPPSESAGGGQRPAVGARPSGSVPPARPLDERASRPTTASSPASRRRAPTAESAPPPRRAAEPVDADASRRRMGLLVAGAACLLLAGIFALRYLRQHDATVATTAPPAPVEAPVAAPTPVAAPAPAPVPPAAPAAEAAAPSAPAPARPSQPVVSEGPDEDAAAQGTGTVLVSATRHHATFLLDGKVVARKAPFQLDDVDAGREHVLEASLGARYPTVLQRFVVTPGHTTILNVRFDRNGGGRVVGSGATSGPTGSIRVESTPPCAVLIDGKRAGTTPLKARLPIGAHHVTLEDPATGAAQRVDVTVREGKAAIVTAAF